MTKEPIYLTTGSLGGTEAAVNRAVSAIEQAADASRWRVLASMAWSLIHFPRTGTYLVCDGEGIALGRGSSAEEAIDHAIQRAEESAA